MEGHWNDAIKLILMAFIPSFAMFLTLPLWFWKKVHNNVIYILAGALWLLPFFLIYMNFEKKWLAILLIAILFFPNAFGFQFFAKRLNLNRCKECHSMGVEIVDQDRETLTTTTTTLWSDGSKTKDVSRRHTNFYSLRCRCCGHTRDWNDRGDNN